MNNFNTQLQELEKHKKWAEIIELLKPLMEQGKETVEVVRSLGFAYSQLDRHHEARYCYKRWIELEPDKAQPYYHVGFTFYDAGQWMEAVEWFDLALERYPKYMVCLYRKGVALFMARKSRKAKETLKKAIMIYQDNQDAQFKQRMGKYYYRSIFYLGKCYFQLRSFKNARSCFEKIIAEDKRAYIDTLFVRYNLALCLMYLKEYEQAEQIVKQLTEKKPRAAWLFDFWGRLLIEQKRFFEAIQKFNIALKIRRQPFILVDRAKANYLCGKIELAKKDLHEALKRDKKGKHKILLELAKIAKEEKYFSEAIIYAKRAIEFKQKIYDADYIDAHILLSEVYTAIGEYQKAMEEWEIVQSLNPELEWEEEILLNSRIIL